MRLFGLIGYPLTHSFSEKYFNDKFEKENIQDVKYKIFPIHSVSEFPEILKSNTNIFGFNITSPYKQSVIPYLDETNIIAAEIHAVNVVKVIRKNQNIKLIGYNTDVYGFQKSLKIKLSPEVKSALILGTGGAAKAVSAALRNLGINYKFVSRTNKPDSQSLNYNSLNEELFRKNLLIINASPVGIFPDVNQKPDIPYEYLTENHHLFDLIYNPEKTQFLFEGEKRKAIIQNGLQMLYFQADKAWEIFNS
ncbi:MAG: shikimate dehydrogenase [Bacteroidales bacterium]|nr:shikimate dehydrogenase [Bacteroidales bacterium]